MEGVLVAGGLCYVLIRKKFYELFQQVKFVYFQVVSKASD